MRIIKRNIEKVWGARYTLGARYLYIIRDAEKVCGARYLLKNTVFSFSEANTVSVLLGTEFTLPCMITRKDIIGVRETAFFFTQIHTWCDNLIPGKAAACRLAVESGKLM
jgi:hypothetical protein